MILIKTLDRHDVPHIIPTRMPSLLISIRSPTATYPYIDSHSWNGVVCLEFLDDAGGTTWSFNIEHAKKIKTAVESREWGSIFVQCESGLRRSPAIAFALKRFYQDKDYGVDSRIRNSFRSNAHVYKKMLECLSGHPLITPEDSCPKCGSPMKEHGVYHSLMRHEIEDVECGTIKKQNG